MKQSQKKWVIEQLLNNGKIGRNECLRNYISRLSAIIKILKNEGWKLRGDFETIGDSRDYVYTLRQRGDMPETFNDKQEIEHLNKRLSYDNYN